MDNNGRFALSLKNDLVFKAVFGRDTEECKFVLMALLNRILGREEDPIVELQYKNPFIIEEYKGEKGSILDIKATTDSGELIDIEMQVCTQEDLLNRLVYYHGGLIRESLKKGQKYDKMLKTITICIVDEVVFPELPGYLNRFFLMEEKNRIRFTDVTEICLIELPKVNRERKPIEELTPLELCLEYIKYANGEGSDYADSLVRHGGKELEMAQFILEKVTEEERLREKALAREKYLRDEISRQASIEKHERLKQEVARDVQELARGQAELARGQAELARGQKELFKEQKELFKGKEELFREQEEVSKGMEEVSKGQEDLAQEKEEFAKEVQEYAREREAAAKQAEDLARRKQELARDASDLEDGQQALENGQQALEDGQRKLKKDQETLKKDQETLEEDQQKLEKERQQLKDLENRYQVRELDLAKQLLADGISVEKIMAYTGLTKKVIESL